MPNNKSTIVFQGKRKEPYTIDELEEKAGLTRQCATHRIKAAIRNPKNERNLFKPVASHKPYKRDYRRNKNTVPAENYTDPETKAKLLEFDKQTLPSLEKLNKYFPNT
jgi:hypothetical protein